MKVIICTLIYDLTLRREIQGEFERLSQTDQGRDLLLEILYDTCKAYYWDRGAYITMKILELDEVLFKRNRLYSEWKALKEYLSQLEAYSHYAVYKFMESNELTSYQYEETPFYWGARHLRRIKEEFQNKERTMEFPEFCRPEPEKYRKFESLKGVSLDFLSFIYEGCDGCIRGQFSTRIQKIINDVTYYAKDTHKELNDSKRKLFNYAPSIYVLKSQILNVERDIERCKNMIQYLDKK